MHGPQGVLGGEVKMPGVAKESGKGSGEQLNQTPTRVRIAVLRRVKPRIKCLVHGEPRAPSLEESSMAIEQLDAGKLQRQTSRSLELLIGQRWPHRHLVRRHRSSVAMPWQRRHLA